MKTKIGLLCMFMFMNVAGYLLAENARERYVIEIDQKPKALSYFTDQSVWLGLQTGWEESRSIDGYIVTFPNMTLDRMLTLVEGIVIEDKISLRELLAKGGSANFKLYKPGTAYNSKYIINVRAKLIPGTNIIRASLGDIQEKWEM